MSQKTNFSQFFSSLYNNEINNEKNNFLNNENSNIMPTLILIESLNNYTIKTNAPININNITRKKPTKNNNSINEYSDLAHSNKDNKNNTNFNFSKFLNRKQTGDSIDFKTKWKTEKCNYWEMFGECKFGENCAFAHGEEELKNKKTNINYKTKLCKQFFEEGFCSYGSRCQFSHKIISNNKYFNFSIKNEKKINYSEIMPNLLLKEQISIKVIKRPRLRVFENIINSNQKELEENRLKLYLDIIDLKNKIRTQINNF